VGGEAKREQWQTNAPEPGDALAGSWGLTLLSARHIFFPTATKRKDPADVSLGWRGEQSAAEEDDTVATVGSGKDRGAGKMGE
jgi:hypothetical protein